jgi:tryptophanyl-tRNA synthetase
MTRILTGIQSSGKPHLGNILGAIEPAIALAQQSNEKSYFFIADLHSMTTIRDAKIRKENTVSVAAAWIALGLDLENNYLYRQSRIPEVCELAWYLGCFMSFSRLSLAHSFKDKSSKLENINTGLFYYPVIMCADILLYDANVIPVGKDQKQHIEFTKEVAKRFNHYYKEDIFTIPEAKIDNQVMTIPGIDGRKMSKSYNNYIDIFDSEKSLNKKIKSIVTESIQLGEPLNPETCNVFGLFKLLANDTEISEMKSDYLNGNIGYGSAKQRLFELIITKYKSSRIKYNQLINEQDKLEKILSSSEEKVKEKSKKILNQVRLVTGFKNSV